MASGARNALTRSASAEAGEMASTAAKFAAHVTATVSCDTSPLAFSNSAHASFAKCVQIIGEGGVGLRNVRGGLLQRER